MRPYRQAFSARIFPEVTDWLARWIRLASDSDPRRCGLVVSGGVLLFETGHFVVGHAQFAQGVSNGFDDSLVNTF